MNNLGHTPLTVPNYSYIFDFEKNFDFWDTQMWFKDQFPNCFYYCGIYVALIFAGKHYMSNRPKYELRGMLILWSALLAIYSIFGFLRSMPGMFHVLRHHGFYHSICIPSHLTQDPVFGFWSWTFALSKLVEFGDTAFIVLRKQPLIFLHWYHHVTVLLYTWFSYAEATGNGKWFGLVNSFVHAWMYSYYALKAMRFNIPKGVAMFVTTLQLSQMVVGCVLTASAYYYVHSAQVECHVTPLNIKLAMLMYLSYFILFARFFQQAYLSNKHINKIGKKD